ILRWRLRVRRRLRVTLLVSLQPEVVVSRDESRWVGEGDWIVEDVAVGVVVLSEERRLDDGIRCQEAILVAIVDSAAHVYEPVCVLLVRAESNGRVGVLIVNGNALVVGTVPERIVVRALDGLTIVVRDERRAPDAVGRHVPSRFR